MQFLIKFVMKGRMKLLVCIDASLIIRTLVPGPYSDQALALVQKWQATDVTLIAPGLLAFEVTSTLRRLVYHDQISPALGDEAFAHFLQMRIQFSNRQSLVQLAWRLAKDFNQSRAYDAAYLATAKLHKCEFWTADERLYNSVSQRINWVKWIGAHTLG